MLTVGLILLLYPVYLVNTHIDFQRHQSLVFVKEGSSVNITCIYQSDMAMHFSWYIHKLGQKPKLISNFYKYDKKATFHYEFKDNARFGMVNEKGITHLVIKELEFSDSAVYYCGSAHSNIVEFEAGTELIVQASQSNSLSVLQQPILELAHTGDSVTLFCTVISDHCNGDHNVYWLRHNSEKSQSGIIYTHGHRNGWCKEDHNAGTPTQTCFYNLPKTNLSPSDAGTYYCAVTACGEILFGNGTNLDVTNAGLGCSEHINILVLFSILRALVLLCFVIVIIMMYFCRGKRKKNTTKITVFCN